MMKIAFYFTSKSLFFLKIFKFLSLNFWLFGHPQKSLIRKIRCLFLRNKQLQYTYFQISQEVKALKFGQPMKYNIRNILLEKSYTKCGGETTPQTFFLKIKIAILPSGMVAEMNHKSLISCSFMFTLVFLYNLTINSK